MSALRSPMFIALITALSAIGQISTSIYLPSMPGMTEVFVTTPLMVKLTLTAFLIGFACAQLVLGAISDFVGRRPVLLAGLVLYIAASFACAFAPSIEWLIGFRIVQSFGACAGLVVGRAIIRDLYTTEESARVTAYVAMTIAISPALGPVLGGSLHVTFGWWASFLALAIFGGIMLLVSIAGLSETNPHLGERRFNFGEMLASYGELLGSPVYLAYALVVAFTMGGLYTFVSAGPFVFIELLGLAPDRYGYYTMFSVLGFFLGSMSGGRYVLARLGIDRTIMLGTSISTCAALLMLAVYEASGLSIVGILGPMFIFVFGFGLSMPAAMAGAVGHRPMIAGTGSALAGFLQMGMAGVASLIIGNIYDDTGLPMVLMLLGFICCAMLANLVLQFSRRREVIAAGEAGD